MCAKFGTIVIANNDLPMGGAGLMNHPIQLFERKKVFGEPKQSQGMFPKNQILKKGCTCFTQ